MTSDYIRSLRAKIGHDLLLLPSVTVLAFDSEDRVLLVRHSNGGRWVAPGGMVEPDEDPSEAALREMYEETGCTVELIAILGVFGGPEFRVTYENRDAVAYVMTVYEARVLEGSPAPNGAETLDIGYFGPAEIARMQTAEWLVPVLTKAVSLRWQRSHGV